MQLHYFALRGPRITAGDLEQRRVWRSPAQRKESDNVCEQRSLALCTCH